MSQSHLRKLLIFWIEDAGHDDLAEVAGEQYQMTLKAFQKLILVEVARRRRATSTKINRKFTARQKL